MKNAFLIFLLFGSQAHADLAQALDPWGNRKHAKELRDNADDLRQQRAARLQDLAAVKADRDKKKAVLDANRQTLLNLKRGAVPTLRSDGATLDRLVENQKIQVENAHGISIEAAEVAKAAKGASVKMTDIRDRAQGAQVLAPLFRNSAENRALWIAAIDKIENKPMLTAPEFRALQKLRAQLSDQGTSWPWQRSEVLFEDFSATLQTLQDSVPQKLVDSFAGRAAQLAAQTKTQFELQTTLLEVLTKLHDDHVAMRSAFNL